MPAGHGLRSRTRDSFSRAFRKKGTIHLSTYLRTYHIGDYVDIKVNGAIHKGMPHKFYHGRTGQVWNVTKRAIGVEINKQVGNRIIRKRIHVRIEHVMPSRCTEEVKLRKKKNDQLKAEAKARGEVISTKRQPEGPKPGFMVEGATLETVTPIPYDVVNDLKGGDTTNFLYAYKGGLRSAIRVARVVAETVALNHTNVRWFVFGDDDTVFSAENLVKVLSKYPGLYGSDARITSCLAELGVTLTKKPGFHQAAHPVAPLISLHHLDIMNPIFPYMTSSMKALEHLYEAAEHDPQRIMQQTVCYDRWFSWTVSVSWGYAVQVYGRNVPLPYLLRAQKTFRSFQMDNYMNNYYNIDVREYEADRCRRAVVFYMDQVSSSKRGEIQSVYRNNALQSMYAKLIHSNCSRRLALPLKPEEIRVFSNKYNPSSKQLLAPRRQCCKVLPSSRGKVMEIAVRECKD
ncbi:hypothetical protein ACET3Z_009864 [Daucus carota]